MSRMFKPLTLGRWPRVLIKILAMPPEKRGLVVGKLFYLLSEEERAPMRDAVGILRNVALANVVLDLPKERRRDLATAFDRELDVLLREDFFGTEGQNDPRGDHRDD